MLHSQVLFCLLFELPGVDIRERVLNDGHVNQLMDEEIIIMLYQ